MRLPETPPAMYTPIVTPMPYAQYIVRKLPSTPLLNTVCATDPLPSTYVDKYRCYNVSTVISS